MSYLGLDREPIEFEWKILPGFTDIAGFFTKSKATWRKHTSTRKSSVIENHLHVYVQRHKRRQKRKRHILYFDICEDSRMRDKIYGRTLDIPGIRKRRKVVSWVWLQTRRKMGLCCFRNGAKFLKSQDIPYSMGQAPWILGICGKRKTMTPFTTVENLQMWSSGIELFTQRISSESTGQSQIGVKRWDKNGIREKRKFWAWIESETVQRAEKSAEDTDTTSFGKSDTSETLKFWVTLSEKSAQTHLWKSRIYHPVERNNWYQTRPDEDDGLGKITPMCREYTHPRELLILCVFQRLMRIPKLDQSWTYVYHKYLVFTASRYWSHDWADQDILHGLRYVEYLKDSWMSCISTTAKLIHPVLRCWDEEMIPNML